MDELSPQPWESLLLAASVSLVIAGILILLVRAIRK